MFTFNNSSGIQNQVGQQNIQGNHYVNCIITDRPLPASDPDGNHSLSLADKDILASLAFPQMFDRRNQIERAHPKTCQWILELDQYRSWKEQTCGLLWIKGKPGAGKSTIMSFLFSEHRIRAVEKHSAPIMLHYFFTARGVELQKTFLGMLRSLLNQLFLQDASARQETRDMYQEKCAAFGQDGGNRNWEWQQQELKSLFSTAVENATKVRQVTIFVDALDEAGEASAREVARYLHEINDNFHSQSLSQGKILISCRHYPIPSTVKSTEIVVEDHNRGDISKFVHDRIQLDGPASELYDTSEIEQWQKLTTKLVLHANGVFQWANLVVPLVEGWIADGESFDQARHLLNEVPDALGEVYNYILQNVIHPRHRLQSSRLFQWICLAERPLSVTEMRYALATHDITVTPRLSCHQTPSFIATDQRMKVWIKTLSGGLAEIVHEAGNGLGHVQVIHQSVDDFFRLRGLVLLASSTRDELFEESDAVSDITSPIKKTHAMMYWSCMRYLATDDVAIAWKARYRASWDQLKQDYSGHDTKLSQSSPFAFYASVNMMSHAEKAGHYRSEDLQQEIEQLQQILPQWIQTYATIDHNTERRPKAGSTVLHAAAMANLVNIVERLVQSKSHDLNTLDQDRNTPLHLAVRWNHETVAKILFTAGARITGNSRWHDTPVITAAKVGHVSLLRWLVSEISDLEDASKSIERAFEWAVVFGDSAVADVLITAISANSHSKAHTSLAWGLLSAACLIDRDEVISLLLAAGVDPNVQGGAYDTPLRAAASKGSEKAVKMLLEAGADVEFEGAAHTSALQSALERGHRGIITLLLSAGASVKPRKGNYDLALENTSEHGQQDMVQMLLKAGVDANSMNRRSGRSCLQAAVSGRHTKVVQVLLDAGADVNARGDIHGTALGVAVSKGDLEMIRMLLKAGAHVNAEVGTNDRKLLEALHLGRLYDNDNHIYPDMNREVPERFHGSALTIAISRQDKQIVQLLSDAGADVNGIRRTHEMPLRFAVRLGCKAIVTILLRAGANVNARCEAGVTALQVAIEIQNEEMVKLLVEAGADVNILGGYYWSALQAAATRRNARIVEILLAAGADVNAQGRYDHRILQEFIYNNDGVGIQLLIDAGAEITSHGGHRLSVLQSATIKGHEAIIQILQEAGAR